MVEGFFKGTIGLAALTLTIGLIAAPLTGSSKAFEIAPVFSAVRGVWGWVTQSASDAQQPEANPRPFVAEAADAQQRLNRATGEALEGLPAIQPDPRLAVCVEGSVQETEEIPLSLAEDFRGAIAAGRQFTELTQLDQVLGRAACLSQQGNKREWRYLVAGGRVIVASQDGERAAVKFSFINF